MKHKHNIIFIIFIPIILFCMVMIFGFSSQDNSQTNVLSSKFTEKIAETIFSGFSAMSVNIKSAIVYELNLLIRKLAHFSLYFFMSMIIYMFLTLWKHKYFMSGILSVLISFIYAVLDEFHQSFVPGRTPLVKDVLIDTSGAILGSIFSFMIIASCTLLYNNFKKNKHIND